MLLMYVANDTVQHDFTLTQPNMIVNPLYIEETLNPNEYFTTSLNVLNNGNGPLGWVAEIIYPEMDAQLAGTVIDELPASMYNPTENSSLNGGNGQALGEDGNRDLMLCPEESIFSIPPQAQIMAIPVRPDCPILFTNHSQDWKTLFPDHFLGDLYRYTSGITDLPDQYL